LHNPGRFERNFLPSSSRSTLVADIMVFIFKLQGTESLDSCPNAGLVSLVAEPTSIGTVSLGFFGDLQIDLDYASNAEGAFISEIFLFRKSRS